MLKSVNILNFTVKLIFLFTWIHQELAAVRADGKKIGSKKKIIIKHFICFGKIHIIETIAFLLFQIFYWVSLA